MRRATAKQRQRAVILQRRRTRKNLTRKRLRFQLRKYRRQHGEDFLRIREIWNEVHLESPKVLSIRFDQPEERAATLAFFKAIVDTPSLKRRTRIVVDLRWCEKIDVTAAVGLIAALETAELRAPGAINGIDPVDDIARHLLVSLNFHRHLKYNPPTPHVSTETLEGLHADLVIETRSGGLGEKTGRRMTESAAAISEILPSSDGETHSALMYSVQNSIHSAMNEALLNILNHAYISTNPGAERSRVHASEHRWWAVGFVNKRRNTFDLVVYDRGVGIPRTLKPDVIDFTRSLFGEDRYKDSARIQAAMQHGRTSKSKSSHFGGGIGMPRILDLISTFPNSSLIVESLSGLYLATHNDGELDHSSFDTDVPLPGTLVFWHLDLNKKMRSDENDNEIEN